MSGVDLWLYGFGFLMLLSVLVPHPAIVGVWVLFFLLPAIALLAFGIVGAVLGSLGCK